MPNYWLGIMAVAFAAALALWIVLVFRAGQRSPGPPQESAPHREVIGGAFAAREGGRQVMPDPGAPLVPETDENVPRQGSPPTAGPGTEHTVPGQGTEHTVPEQGKDRVPEQTPARGDRP